MRPEERFAEALLRRVLKIEVTQRDDNSAAGMVDALFRLPDGREGALEVTTIGDAAALERESLAASSDWTVAGARGAWTVLVGDGVDLRVLRRHLRSIVLTSESSGDFDPRRVPFDERQNEAFQWLQRANVSMVGVAATSRPGAIDVLPDGNGGAAFEHLDELPMWLTLRLREADLDRKIEKLRTTGRPELHLFLRIHDPAMPFSLYYPLAWGDSVPTTPLQPPEGLTAMWLVPAWKNPILWWSSHRGWRREECVD